MVIKALQKALEVMSQSTERLSRKNLKPRADGLELSRRDFLMTAAISTLALDAKAEIARPATASYTGKLCLFSKHLAGMDARTMARNLKRLGFGGVDLTVRPSGHVLPERAIEELPKAVRAIREEGLEVPMISTALVSAADPTAQPILATAGKLSIPFYKPGYYRYEFVDVRKELERAALEFRRLAELGKQYQIQVGYHNHAGYIGAPLWDIAPVIDGLDPKWVGYYFDVRHAVVEGGDGGWKIAANLVSRRLKMIAVKDFYWEKTATGGWRVRNCPLGEGMVDWKSYFKFLAAAQFQGPVSLHLEYEVAGSTPAAKEENTLVAIQRDFEFLKARVQEAYGKA
jgi:L-ribulose-5-phosphate 3-epimerase